MRLRRNAANLDKTESEPPQPVEIVGVFIQSGGKPHRVGEVETHHPRGFVDTPIWNQAVKLLQHFQADIVRLFGVKREQQWFYQGIKH